MAGIAGRSLGPLEEVARSDRERYTLRGARSRVRIGLATGAVGLAGFSLGAGITEGPGLEPESLRAALGFAVFALFFWEGALVFRVIQRIDGLRRRPEPVAASSLREVCRTRSEWAATSFARLRPALPCTVGALAVWGASFAALWIAPQSALAAWVLPASALAIWMLEALFLSRVLERVVAGLEGETARREAGA